MKPSVASGQGWAVGSLDALGEGHGFRKIRQALGVQAFGINAIVLPPGFKARWHFHERQEETYFVHRGTIAIEFGDGTEHVLREGGIARVDAATHRRLRNPSQEDAIVLVAGGHVGRDGRLPEGETARFGTGGPDGAGA